jgi:hypothetical protein
MEVAFDSTVARRRLRMIQLQRCPTQSYDVVARMRLELVRQIPRPPPLQPAYELLFLKQPNPTHWRDCPAPATSAMIVYGIV